MKMDSSLKALLVVTVLSLLLGLIIVLLCF